MKRPPTGNATATVRPVTIDDATAIARILNSVIAEGGLTIFDRPFSDDDERRFIAALASGSALHVAELAGVIVGVQSLGPFASLTASTRHVATMGTWLRADARGRGIGRRLAVETFAFARKHEYSKIVVQVLATNTRALNFYRRLGFEDIGVAKRHVVLGGRFFDEVYLEKFLA